MLFDRDRLLRAPGLGGGAALRNDALEILLGAFDQRKQGTARGTCGFTENGHVAGVASEAGDILMNPFERHQLVQQSQVLCIRVILAVRQVRQMEETEETDPVRDGHGDDIRALPDEAAAIILRIGRSADIESTAVDPHHDRLIPGSRLVSLPDVQIQAVLARAVFGSGIARRLDGGFRIAICLVDAVIRNDLAGAFQRRSPTGCFPTNGMPLKETMPSVFLPTKVPFMHFTASARL